MPENLQDHISVGLSHEVKPEVKTLDPLFRDPKIMNAALADYNLNQAGPLCSSPVQAIAFLPSTVLSTLPPSAPSVQTLLDIYLPLPIPTTTSHPTVSNPALTPNPSFSTQHALLRSRILSPTSPTATLSPIPQGVYPSPSPKNYLTTLLMLSYPLSRGHTHIRSPRPNVAPTIAPNYLSHPLDLALTALHLMHASTLFTLRPLADLLAPPATAARLPHGHHAETYDAAVELLRGYAGTFYHPVGTCALMGREMGGVVDERLVVYGTRNLRVVDASVIPMVPRANVASSVFAWGERGAEIVREEWERGGGRKGARVGRDG